MLRGPTSRFGPRSAGNFTSRHADLMVDVDPRQSAYSRPTDFERHQIDTGHLDIERMLLSSMLGCVGKRVVSVGCGTGVLDRELIMLREKDLIKGRTSLRLLGVDSEKGMIEQANSGMDQLLGRNPALAKCIDEGRLSYEYRVATLGERSFADMDLNDTVIQSRAPDTFMAFMVFVLWVEKRETAIRAIAEKSRGRTGPLRPTTFINAEEYPTHMTSDTWLTPSFKRGIEERKAGEVDPKEIWAMFIRHGFRFLGSSRKTHLGGPEMDHNMWSAVLEHL